MNLSFIFLFLTICLNTLLGLVVYFQSPKEFSLKPFFMIIVGVFLWATPLLLYGFISDPELALSLSKISYFAAGLSSLSLISFAINFSFRSKIKKKTQNVVRFLSVFTLLILAILCSGRYLISHFETFSEGIRIISFGPFYSLYLFAISSFFVIGLIILYYQYRKEEEEIRRKQFQFIFAGILLTLVGSLITNLILPSFGNFNYYWLGPIFTLIMVIFFTISILKYRLFSTKVVTTELIVFTLWIFILVRTLIAQTGQDLVINAILLILLVVVGIFLIRSVIKEVSQREKIELLAKDLQKANDRLRELDKQKSEFVSFATHQLRAPLTAMKGYASLILEGDLGKLSRDVRSAITRIYDSSNTLANIVDDYLNISRIELGSMKYSFEVVDLKDLLDHVIGELRPNLEKSKLNFVVDVDRSQEYRVNVDKDKFKQIIANLVDNSVKYTPTGSITVSIQKKREMNDPKIVFSVKDTGIGIAPEVLPKLFAKFTRADNGTRQNIHGTGLGLYVAKEIVTAHKGKIWAESGGEGRGSAFHVELEEVI